MSLSRTLVFDKGAEVQRTEQTSDSDSIMLKKDAKGVMSWEIKVYCKLDTAQGVMDTVDSLEHIHEKLTLRFK